MTAGGPASSLVPSEGRTVSWFRERTEDLVGAELAAAEARRLKWLRDQPCVEPSPTERLMAAMRKAMNPELQRPAHVLPFIVEVSEEEAARVAESGVLVVPKDLSPGY